jgi:hypothetical protein
MDFCFAGCAAWSRRRRSHDEDQAEKCPPLAKSRSRPEPDRVDIDDRLLDELKRVRAELLGAGFKPFVGAVDAAPTA